MLGEIGGLYPLIVLAGFAFIGGSLKYIDSAFDEHVFDKRSAYPLAAVCGLAMGAFIAFDQYAGAVLASIVIAVALAKKIDNPAFLFGTAIVLLVPALAAQNIVVLALPVGVLSIAGMADEYGNNIVDSGVIRNKLVTGFFKYRLMLQAAMGVLTLLGFFPLVYWAGLVYFDSCYHAMSYHALQTKMSLNRSWSAA